MKSELLDKTVLSESEYVEIPTKLKDEFDYILDKIVEFNWVGRVRNKFSAVEAWTEGDEIVFIYTYEHCSTCGPDPHTLRFSKTILDADNFKEQIDVHFIELNADKLDLKVKKSHFKKIELQRAKIRLLRELAQEFSEYLDLSIELPELPNYPNLLEDYQEPSPNVMLLTKQINSI